MIALAGSSPSPPAHTPLTVTLPSPGQQLTAAGTLRSASTPPRLYETHDSYDPPRFTTPTRQRISEQQTTPAGLPLHRLPSNLFSRPSSSSGTSHSLRRTPGIEDLHRPRTRSASVGAAREDRSRPQVRFASPAVDPSQSSGSQQRPIPDPHHALRISRRTLSAILVAVEALRTPNPFTPDLEEELAPMSDIMSGAAAGGGRAANGGKGPIPVQSSSSPPVSQRAAVIVPPTEIMRRREERAKAQQERAQATGEAERRRLQSQWEEGYDTDPTGGVASPPPPAAQSQPAPSQPQASATHRRTQSSAVPSTARPSGGQPVAYAQPSQQSTGYSPSAPAVQAPQNVPAPTQQQVPSSATQSRPRASTARQPRPVQASAPASANPRPQQPAQAQRPPVAASSQARPPQEPPEVRAERQRLAQEAGLSAGTTAEAQTQGRRGGDGSVSTFPHAFERWEMLSSKWEGMTSHWISRLQMNSEELQNQPMLAQLSRQVTDLSAAGANLFTALVELQRLRASSERKFQRWFHDTRNEMERQQELVGQLERALIQERRDRADDQVNWEKLVDNARRTEMNFSRLNAEKDRELQIAKDESRRAWEELGRYEALERERQKALAQGLPVEIGGYTVYPRLFPDSRQGSAPPSRQADPRPTSRRGPQTSQSIQDDPFVADVGAGDTMQGYPEEDERESYAPPPTTAYSSSQAYTSAAGGYPTTTNGGGYTSFSAPPPGPSQQSLENTGFYNQQNTHLGPNLSMEDLEYERDEHGNILTDEYGRPLSYRRGLHEARSSESEGEGGRPAFTSFGANDPADTRRRYPGGNTQSTTPQGWPASSAHQGQSMQTRPEADFGFFNEEEEEEDEEERRPSYSGQGYGDPPSPGDEGAHYHPTRLSDVPEEDELSRASEAGASRGGGGHVGIVNVTGAPF